MSRPPYGNGPIPPAGGSPYGPPGSRPPYGPPPGYRPGAQPYPQQPYPPSPYPQQPYPPPRPSGYPAGQPVPPYRPPVYPPPPPYGPPGPPRRRRGRGGALAMVLVLIVVGVLVRVGFTGLHAVHTDQGGYTYSPPGDDPGAGGVAAAAANPLLAAPGSALSPARCTYAPWGTDVATARAFFDSAAGCLRDAWQPVLAALKVPFTPPKVQVSADTQGISTPCTGDSTDFAAFYCPADQTIYLPISTLQTNLIKDHWEVYLSVFAHEYGHHIQALTGIMTAANKQRRSTGATSAAGLAVSRQIELQANCFDGMYLSATTTAGSVTSTQAGNARQDAYERGDRPGDMRDHGTAKHMGDWWSTGFDDDKTAQCNTFAAPANQTS